VKILVLHTLPPADCANGRRREEFDLSEAAGHVASALDHALVAGVRGDASEIAGLIEAQRPDVVFNLCEAPLGRPALEPHAAALFEWIGVAFTGSGSETLALCRRKPLMNAVLAAHGVAVPRAGMFPAIVKPADEDGSVGISIDAVCEDAGAVERARARWPGPVVVEEFVEGREFAVSLWGRREPEHVSIAREPMTGSEDFARYLEHVPGCFVFVGNGEHSAPLHNSAYDFNDDGLLYGVRFHVAIARQRLRRA